MANIFEIIDDEESGSKWNELNETKENVLKPFS